LLGCRSANRISGGYSHTSYDSRPLSHRYLDFLQDFYQIPAVAEYVDSKAVEDSNFSWLKSQIGISAVGASGNTEGEYVGPAYDECKKSVVVVSGAGMREVDGIYHFHRMFKNCGLFRKTGKYGSDTVLYSLYRCTMDNGELRWYISIVPDHREPGSTADIDFYCSAVAYREGSRHDNDPKPPTSNWEAVESKYRPAPTIVCTYDGSDDSDREDSLAVADDDDDLYNSSSVPGTPGGPESP
jgi:hypothetical protein